MKALLVPFDASAFAQEIYRLNKKHPAAKPPHVKVALDYLQIKLDDHATSKLEKEAATKKRRLDLWERNFLREAEEDGYS